MRVTLINWGRWLACDDGLSCAPSLADTVLSQASPLPH